MEHQNQPPFHFGNTVSKTKGYFFIEIGNGQYKKVSQILKFNNFIEKFLVKDYKNNIRSIFKINSTV